MRLSSLKIGLIRLQLLRQYSSVVGLFLNTRVLFYTNIQSYSANSYSCAADATTCFCHPQTSCSEKWLAPWATAAAGLRLPSQRCLILMQVNPTLTSSSPPWPIISPTLPLSPPNTLCSYSHFQPPLSPITRNLSHPPPSIPYIGLISLSFSLLLLTPPCCLSSFPHLRVALRRFQSPFGSSSNCQTDGQIKSPFTLSSVSH